jgi:hypothetical protein
MDSTAACDGHHRCANNLVAGRTSQHLRQIGADQIAAAF